MITYLPNLYTDELFYSFLSRYRCHTTPVYSNAIEDILEKKTIRPDIEYINHLNEDAKKLLTRKVSMEKLIIDHTMFPSVRFAPEARRNSALQSMIIQEGDVHHLLPIPKGKEIRYLKYCPLCAIDARERYGEAYWTRQANIRNINICARHKCRLKPTKIEISNKKSGRLYVAEEEINDTVPEFVDDGLELQFAQYMTEVFQRPIDMQNTVAIGEFLNFKLEGSKYLSARGKMRNVSLLFQDFIEFYKELPNQGITKLSQMQKIFTGYRWDFYEVCQMAFFLKLSADDLINPKMPEKSQTEIFNEKVARLYDAGLGCHRIAREMGCSPSTAKNANRVKTKAEHDYSVRKGIKREDWRKMDEQMLQQVSDTCEQIYYNDGGRPGHVTVNAVCRALGLPDKRFDYLPKCKNIIYEYGEKKEIYWAREVVWCYQELIKKKEEEEICWRNIRDATNIRKDNFIASFPYLHLFTNADTADKIKNLLPI